MQLPRDRRRILAGERDAHGVGSARGGARREHALERGAPLGEQALGAAAALGDTSGVGAQRPRLALQRGEGAVRIRDGALGIAQRVARFAPGLFLGLEFLA
jgi:hypothetical protein